MSKFAASSATASRSPISTKSESPDTQTFESAQAWSYKDKSELFLLAVTNMVSENTFYEKGQDRDSRYRQLVRNVTQADPAWMQAFIPWLRYTANMRSAPVVALAEYVKAGGPEARALVAKTLSRADELAELTGYWLSRYGKPLPKAIKRGISDRLNRLTEYEALKYDSQSNDVRLGDVINLVHPKPVDNLHSHLFKYLLDRRHQGKAEVDGRTLKVIKGRQQMEAISPDQRRNWIEGGIPEHYGVTWEYLSGWLPGGMDAQAWEAVIPHMGYMALLRNLRNFDEAKISAATVAHLKAELSHPDNVARSRQFPYRFFSAYKQLGSVRWSVTLEEALNHSVANIPAFSGRTLVMTDTSSSMTIPVSERSSICHYEIAALFAAAVGARSQVDLISFASGAERIPYNPGDAILVVADRVRRRIGQVGHGTDFNPGLKYFDPMVHDRIVIFTDGQVRYPPQFPKGVPVYIFDTSGYGRSPAPVGEGMVHAIGGFTDAAFKMIPYLEQGRQARWPWETE